MSVVNVEKHDDVAVVRLNNGITNAVNAELVRDLNQALDVVMAEKYRSMVLAGGEKFFCIGLNIPGLINLDKAAMTAFWDKFDNVVAKLYAMPVPVICAYQGHATAAGSIFASACDFRYAAAEKPLFGFNEVAIGLAAPLLTYLMLEQMIGSQKAIDLFYNGRFVKPEEALEMGIVDAIFDKSEVEAQAIAKAKHFGAFEHKGFAATKSHKTNHVLERFESGRKKAAQEFLNCWFDDKVQTILQEAAKKF